MTPDPVTTCRLCPKRLHRLPPDKCANAVKAAGPHRGEVYFVTGVEPVQLFYLSNVTNHIRFVF